VHEVLAEALVHKIAVVFALNRRRLGAAVGKNARIAVVGIRDDGGANAAHEQVCLGCVYKFGRLLRVVGVVCVCVCA
jgi:ribosomal protein L7Ae-like RNA K-turn-binding protein